MKPITLYAAAIITLFSSLTACSDIETDQRLIEVDNVTAVHKVLIEDFTGQRCVNCPKATDVIDTLITRYGNDNIIPVSIHCGPFAKSTRGKTLPLWTKTGDVYYDNYGVSVQPTGLIGRKDKSSDISNWETKVRKQLNQETEMSIQLHLDFNTIDSLITAKVDMKKTATNSIVGKLQLWILEDSIVSFQYMPDGSTNRNYVHNHVFRTAINGDWGDEIKLKSSPISKTYIYKVDKAYRPDKLSVVAFVYNDNGVVEVARTYVKEQQ